MFPNNLVISVKKSPSNGFILQARSMYDNTNVNKKRVKIKTFKT